MKALRKFGLIWGQRKSNLMNTCRRFCRTYLACVPRAPIFRFRVGRGWLQCLRNKSVTVHITCMRLAMTMHLDALELSGFWLLRVQRIPSFEVSVGFRASDI